jgi:hypothetical protein
VGQLEDDGKTWNAVGQSEALNRQPIEREDADNTGPPAPDQHPLIVKEFAFDSRSRDTVYILSRKGIYRSVDSGQTWTVLNLGFGNLGTINSVAVDPLNSDNILAGSWEGPYLSNDKGCHFHQLRVPSMPEGDPQVAPQK